MCNAQVALVMFDDKGRLTQFSSTEMDGLLEQYGKAVLEPHERFTPHDVRGPASAGAPFGILAREPGGQRGGEVRGRGAGARHPRPGPRNVSGRRLCAATPLSSSAAPSFGRCHGADAFRQRLRQRLRHRPRRARRPRQRRRSGGRLGERAVGRSCSAACRVNDASTSRLGNNLASLPPAPLLAHLPAVRPRARLRPPAQATAPPAAARRCRPPWARSSCWDPWGWRSTPARSHRCRQRGGQTPRTGAASPAPARQSGPLPRGPLIGPRRSGRQRGLTLRRITLRRNPPPPTHARHPAAAGRRTPRSPASLT
jgi:hypothetical protein